MLRNTGFSFVQQASAMGLAILLVPYMLWMLGPEKYGLWLIVQLFNIVGLSYLAELGFQGAIVRYLARFHAEGEREAFRGLLSSGFALFAAIGLAMATGVIAFAQWGATSVFPVPAAHAQEVRLALTIVGAGLIAGFPGLALKAYFAGRQELATTKVWELCDRLVFSLGTLVLLQTTTSIAMLVLFEQVLGLALTILFALAAWRGSQGWFTLRAAPVAREHLRGVLRMSGSVFATNLVSQGFNRLPELFVGAVLGPVTLTAYQIATRIPRVIKTLQGSLNAAVLPHIAGLDAGERAARDGLRSAFALNGLRANYIVATPLLVSAALLAPVLLDLWVGEEYRALGGYMAAFALFQALFLAGNYCSATLTRQEHFTLFVRCNLAVCAGFVAALAIGLDRWGLDFVFGALVVSAMAMFACVFITFRIAHGVSAAQLARAVLIGPVLLSGLLGLAFLGPGAWLLAAGEWLGGGAALAVGLCAYVLAIFGLVLDGEEQRLIAGLLRRESAV